MSGSTFEQRCSALELEVDRILALEREKKMGKIEILNVDLRRIYSDVEILRLDAEEAGVEESRLQALCSRLDKLIPSLRLRTIKRKSDSILGFLLSQLDIAIRFVAVSMGFVTAGGLFSLVVLLMQWIDDNIFMKLGLVDSYSKVTIHTEDN